MSETPEERRFDTREALIEALTADITTALSEAAAARGRVSFVGSGGTTPGPLYDRLAEAHAPWDRVGVTLADERWVPPDDPRSNERQLRERLLRGRAVAARFVPMKTAAREPEDAETVVDAALRTLPRPFDVMLLGLGENGHTASLFPHGLGLARALDTADPALVRAVRPVPPDDPDPPRMSMTARALLDSRSIILLFTGETKWAVYQQALAQGPVEALPVRAVLHQARTPVQVWWAP
jgi:6-phosphogluconolactonase